MIGLEAQNETHIISDAAKDLIKGLIVPTGRKHLPIHHIKRHIFFQSVKWADIELAKVKMPERLRLRLKIRICLCQRF